jgi:hypothetical protein
MFSAIAGLLLSNLAAALVDRQYLPELTIKSDGDITVRQVFPPYEESQAPAVINRTGNVYTLTADVEGYAVRIDCSNIVFDGGGHTIHASPAFANSGLRLFDVTDVTVKNVEVIGDTFVSIFLVGSNCLITSVKTDALRVNSEGFNTITESNITKLTLWRGSNLVSKCNISKIYLMDWSGSNVFTQNNFLFNNSTDGFSVETYSANFWDNGSMGNYWSDYLTKYPNASEVGNTGIGDTPYVLDADNVDHYPLVYPLGAPAVSVFSLGNATYFGSFLLNFSVSKPATWIGYSLDGLDNVTVTGNTTLAGLSSGLHNVTVYAKDAFENTGASETVSFTVAEEPFPIVPVATASVAIVAVVGVGLLFYFKKRKR